jgi:hypothetical protein
MVNPSHIEYVEAALLDRFLDSLCTKLTSSLSWLDNAYGNAQALKEYRDGRTHTFPAVPTTKGKEYLRMFPDEHLGNFIWFDVPGYDIQDEGRPSRNYEATGSLICWFDLRRVYPNDWTQRGAENVKNELLSVLSSRGLTRGKIRLRRSYDRQADIYRGYSDTEIENQYMMRPYGAFRIELTITFNPDTAC